MNTGSSKSATSVSCHESTNMMTSTMPTLMRLPMTLDRMSVNASCAPVTSLLRRLTRAPVCVRVKKARGMRCTWSNTWVRMS